MGFSQNSSTVQWQPRSKTSLQKLAWERCLRTLQHQLETLDHFGLAWQPRLKTLLTQLGSGTYLETPLGQTCLWKQLETSAMSVLGTNAAWESELDQPCSDNLVWKPRFRSLRENVVCEPFCKSTLASLGLAWQRCFITVAWENLLKQFFVKPFDFGVRSVARNAMSEHMGQRI